MKISVLVVDDELLIRKSLGKVLRARGYTVDLASTGAEGLEKVASLRPQVMILDMRLPDTDGLTVLRGARQLDPLLQVIIITAYGDVQTAVDAMKVGACDFVRKPYEMEDIVLAVESAGRTFKQASELDLYRRRAWQHYSGEEIIGSEIRIRNVPLRVIGILASKGQSITGQDQDDLVVLPFTTAERKVLGTQFLGTVGIILVAAQTRHDIPAVVDDIKDLLRAKHHLQSSEEDDFTIRTMEDIAKTIAGTSRTMMLMLMGIASISLVVGGIGIMNILLVSVTERTREIGLRMAVGAKRIHILLQFLIEAVIMTTIGGFLGVGAGIGISLLLTKLIGWPTIINTEAVTAAFLFSLVVGIFFGLYPANKASKLNPIEALHYE